MMKYIAIFFGVVMALLVGILLFLKNKKSKQAAAATTQQSTSTATTATSTNNPTTASGCRMTNFSNSEIRSLQTILNDAIKLFSTTTGKAVFAQMYPSKTLPTLLNIDGIFGANTKNALVVFTGKTCIERTELQNLSNKITGRV